ncbi:Pyruvate/2-oxoglutarate dehydrogenase complex dihydrolipoamide dehydrogenase (E3) component-like enzyme [Nitrosococcus oceani ATCC 19707]|uniref:Pyruvate/2-oxoglutarate dehydrogenase complex dihydrolipoamide dehydrogenase (E3) component-like enzyme n=2 Tax=Nitrosococcus oceani TaxID=1229 RepID=Q3JDI8_NITOC|nr:bifunctional TVP38/TMEM64 family protein/FAD-dependent oxidoreductase [Nitrosococcus oceani]ABA57108.1 Pyruvate/2-oxoglutarate dehydrogenase complex dihydrolipoamide dehydrogenase (E3) component-like enzyme [Nitrosococcus oceani ATCC 19707]EDZ65471.1 tRNA uridine 5-carboxymethylaminomethyl modification enzyme GidA, putative [Nitrosococcus oceani AFC27]KFI20469.1 pyridine nucleotide-disulfide oxidoreductase [Nitrosococcus oceani C-27]GEM19871.1 pyridine nucleotide-disulfide oxidoreductase [Ni
MKKAYLLMVITALVVGFFFFDLDRLLTLEGLKQGLAQFEAWRTDQPMVIGGAFLLLYVLVTALSLPGAAVMTLAAGALFGLLWGTIIVSFASTVGATLAFLISRYLLHDTVQKRFGDRLKPINEGIKKDGAFYLFTLRLVPVFPFFLINLLMGLTPIRALTFFWVSQVGMLAGTLVYVNAGTQLAQLDSLSGILSPSLLLSFALLGVFPLLAKKLLAVIKARRVYAGYQKPSHFDRNLIVIGAGAGGLVTAYIAAAVKAKVTLIEAHKMGGDCLNYGCVPSKALIKSAKLAHQMRQADHYGLEATSPHFSFRKVMARVHEVIRQVEPHDSIERYEGLGVEIIQGYARLVDPWTVEIKRNDGSVQQLTSRSIVLATGARPFIPPLPGIKEVGYVTSDTLWDEFAKLDEAPKRLVVLGGGPIGCELAQSFTRLGSQVTQVEMAPRILIREDEEVSEFAKASLQGDGVAVLTNHKALRCEKQGGTKRLIMEYEGVEKIIEFDTLLCAVGRVARLQGYGLEELGIETNRTIVTNDYLETLYPNIYAAGDVAGPYQFTHTAAHQAWYAAVNALFSQFKRFKVDYRIIPWTTFIDPEVAQVGLNEQEAKKKGIAFEVTRYGLEDLDRAITDGAAHGFVKVLTEPGKDRILGVTIVGKHGGDLMAEFVLAMKHGLGLSKILGTIHAYPTWAEANKYAAGEWKRAHAPERVLIWLEKYHQWRRGNAKTSPADGPATKHSDASDRLG